MFLAAKITIAMASKSPVIGFNEVKTDLVMLQEKLVSILWDKLPLFEKVWTPCSLNYRCQTLRIDIGSVQGWTPGQVWSRFFALF